jgi:rubredoxin
MIAIRRGIALSIVCAAAPAALLLSSTPAAAKHGVKSIEVGPIWNNMDAQHKCPKAAAREGGTWTGDWRTTRPGMSECDIKFDRSGWDHHGGGWHGDKKREVEAGPIWNQMDADRKCPEVARKEGGTWTGQWRTTRPGMMSVCEIKR